jgi:hypothetical protein
MTDLPAAAVRPTARRVATGVLTPLAAIALVVAALRVPVPGPLSDLLEVGFALVIVAAAAAAVLAKTGERTPQWQVAAGSASAAAALACYRLSLHLSGGSRHAVVTAYTIGVLVVVAVSVHLLLALPDGRLTRPHLTARGAVGSQRPVRPSPARRITVGAGYGAALVGGAALGSQDHPISVPLGAIMWAAALAITLPALRLSYLASAGRERERLQWIGASAVLAAGLALAATVLRVLVSWPPQLAATTAACTVLLPLGVMAGEARSVGPSAGRALVQLIAVAGFAVVVSAIHVIVVLGVGNGPATDSGDRELLGLSMLAAAIAAVGYLPARERLLAWAKHAVYGAREAPDEALRTFGSRLTRAIPMDELLLQLAESLRKTMALTSAEVYTGAACATRRARARSAAGCPHQSWRSAARAHRGRAASGRGQLH